MDTHTPTTAPTIVNGINLDDLFALIARVRIDPAAGKTHWRVGTTWQGQTRSRSEVEGFGLGNEVVPRRFTIDIDEASSAARTGSPTRRNTCSPR